MPTPAPSWRSKSPVILNYGIAVLATTVAVVVDVAFNRLWGINPTVSLFLCAIMFVAWVSGTGPALLATVLTILAFDYFLLEPIYSFVLDTREIPRLVLFAIAALFIVWLSAAQRRAEASLRRARDERQETVRDLQTLNEKLRIENAERKQVEERVRLAGQELQTTIDTIPVLAARYRPDGFMEFRNQAWAEYTGLSQSNLEGHRWGGALHPDDLPIVEREWREHIATGEPFDLEQRLRGVDGEYRWHWVRRVPLRDEAGEVIKWYGVAFDIDDRKRVEDALRQSEAELAKARHEVQLIIDSVPVLILRHRADGIIDFVNQVGRSYSGIATTNWTRRTSVITHPDDVQKIEEAWDVALATGEPFETEARLRRPDGEYRWFATRRAPQRNDDGEVIAWYAATYDIEDRKRAEDALRRSEAQLASAEQELRLTLDSIPTLIASYWPNGERDFVNRAWERFTGISQEAARGATATSTVHPDRQALAAGLWQASLTTGEPYELEERLRRADGEYRWHRVDRLPLRDESGNVVKWYSVGHDIEDLKQAESALQRSEAQLANAERELRLTLDSIPTLVWRAGREGSPDFLNQPALDYTGLSLDQAETGWPRAFHPDDKKGMLVKWSAIRQSGMPGGLEARLRRFDGEYRWFLFQALPLRDEAGNIVKWYGSSTDIEDRKQAESALHAAQSALAHASRVAMLGEISATIAHEVNQPLAAIVANAQACLRFLRHERPRLDDVRGAIEWIVKDGNRASEVIQRVRGLLKKADTHKAPLDVNDIINEVGALLQRELAAQRVALRLDLAPALPLITADRVQLQQVIINLVMNGADAMQTIANGPRALMIRSRQAEPDQVLVAVKDSGVGIAPGNAERLFAPFFSTKPSGLGMGLAICHSIIEDHGGRLWAADNDEGPGATFQFALPSQPDGPHALAGSEK
jgi:PAS domain S-box-containing protein